MRLYRHLADSSLSAKRTAVQLQRESNALAVPEGEGVSGNRTDTVTAELEYRIFQTSFRRSL